MPAVRRRARAIEFDDVPGEDLRLFVVHHVTCARHGDDLEIADVRAQILGGGTHAVRSAVFRIAPREEYRSLDPRPAGLRFLAAIEDGVDEAVARVEQ